MSLRRFLQITLIGSRFFLSLFTISILNQGNESRIFLIVSKIRAIGFVRQLDWIVGQLDPTKEIQLRRRIVSDSGFFVALIQFRN